MEGNSTNIEGDTLTIVRIFDAPVEKVWKAWTDPEEIKKWHGPKDFTAPYIDIDFRVGGKGVFCMHGPKGSEWDKDMYSAGVYKEIVPMEKIVMTDYFSDKDGNWVSPGSMGMPGKWPEELLVTITFEDIGDGKTKLTLMHKGHPEEIGKMAGAGWNESLDKLAASLR